MTKRIIAKRTGAGPPLHIAYIPQDTGYLTLDFLELFT
jgi:hypothetical protein